MPRKRKKTAKREQEYTNWLDEGRKLRTLRGDELIASFALSYVWLPSPINIDNHLTSSSGATSPPPFFIYTHSACPETCKALSSSPLPGRSCYPPPCLAADGAFFSANNMGSRNAAEPSPYLSSLRVYREGRKLEDPPLFCTWTVSLDTSSTNGW